MRPQSILWFERLYIANWLIAVVNVAITWRGNAREIAAAGLDRTLPGYQYIVVGLGLLIPLVLWYCIARRASRVAKWALVVMFFIGLVSLIVALAGGRMPYGVPGVLGAGALILQSVAVWMLFRDDARRWLGEVKPAATEPAA